MNQGDFGIAPIQAPAAATRKTWVVPAVVEHASLTSLTQYAPPGAFAMLFQTGSQCFDMNGQPKPCNF